MIEELIGFRMEPRIIGASSRRSNLAVAVEVLADPSGGDGSAVSRSGRVVTGPPTGRAAGRRRPRSSAPPRSAAPPARRASHSARAARLPLSRCRPASVRVDQLATAVARIGRPVEQAELLEAGEGGGHRLRTYALEGRQCGRGARLALAEPGEHAGLGRRQLVAGGHLAEPTAQPTEYDPDLVRRDAVDESVVETVTIVSLACSVWTDESHRFRSVAHISDPDGNAVNLTRTR